jgi:predicted HNH restriction endonuclease
MTAKERKRVFKTYLEEVYKPYVTSAENVYRMNGSLSSSLSRIHAEYGSIFELEDKEILKELSFEIKNPSGGAVAFRRKVQNFDLKQAFIQHYATFLDKLHSEELAQKEKENKEEEDYLEGQLTETKFFKRKRSKALRDECIKRYGCRCFVCGFDFEVVYGERGKGFIEVHHLNPMANYDDEHSISVDELRPLCSNCHTMIHRDPRKVSDIDEFKAAYLKRNCNHP